MEQSTPILFTAHIIPGRERGRTLGVPTFNLDLTEVPEALSEGVYAVRAYLGEHPSAGADSFAATMHYGPRPTFGDTESCEIHLLNVSHVQSPTSKVLTIEVMEWMREVKKFEDAEALKRQMAEDIAQTRAILAKLPHTS